MICIPESFQTNIWPQNNLCEFHNTCTFLQKGYFILKISSNADFKDFWYTNTIQTQIWYDVFNYYASKGKNSPPYNKYI